MKSAVPPTGTPVQASSTPNPYAGGYVSQRRLKHSHIFNRATAFVLADSHQDYVVHSRLRNILRALIVLGVFSAVIALTVTKYVTDNDLRSSTVTVREENVGKLSGPRIELAQCPCQNDTLLWSDFVTYQKPLAANGTAQIKLCQEAIVPELKTAQEPTITSTPAEVQAYIGYLDKLQANFATQLTCTLALQQVVEALDPDPSSHVLGLGDSFYNTELLSERQAYQRLANFIGGKVLAHTQDFAAQLTLQGLFLQNLDTNYTKTAGDFINVNTTAGLTAAQAAEVAVRLAANMTKDAVFALAGTTANQAYIGNLLHTVQNAVTLNYTAYMDACMPYYCDYTNSKSGWSRVTEFLGLLGGLYTTLLGVGFLLWILVDLALPGDHGKFMV